MRAFHGFHNLMQIRVREILLVATPYDAFVLEEDGGLAEQIFSRYLDLNLRYIPRITPVTDTEEALDLLEERTFDLVITMARLATIDPVEFGMRVKTTQPDLPVVLLALEALDPPTLDRFHCADTIDTVFYWLGDSTILLSTIKYIEDRRNAPHDTEAGVQTIILVEDDPRVYSTILPMLYTELVVQTQRLISESINDYQRLLRMRARPKILLAESYEAAIALFERYRNNVLGIISDISYPREGMIDDEAGYRLAETVSREVSDLPILLQSNRPAERERAEEVGRGFLDKTDPQLLEKLRGFVIDHLGFGDFVFRMPNGEEVARARNVQEFDSLLHRVPLESVEYHARNNHISIWLRARTEFALAEKLRPRSPDEFPDPGALVEFLSRAVRAYLEANRSGTITDPDAFTEIAERAFVRVGSGSLGGKARGLAFFDSLLSRSDLRERYPGFAIDIPTSYVFGTDLYDEFLEINGLGEAVAGSDSDEGIARRFVAATLPPTTRRELERILDHIHAPLAVRSSSVLEDSPYLPFAGLYSTYMLPNSAEERTIRLGQLETAIKLVYASLFYAAARSYLANASYRLEEGKMAVIVQEVAGRRAGERFYPVVSGVAQTYNFYPHGPAQPEDGLVHLALGLGRSIVDGSPVYRFSPRYPRRTPPVSGPEELLDRSQRSFWAIDLSRPNRPVVRDEVCTMVRAELADAEEDGTLHAVGATFDVRDGRVRNSIAEPGPRLVNFARLVASARAELPALVNDLLEMGRYGFGTDVEIEFALELPRVGESEEERKPHLSFLQIRPIVLGRESNEVSVASLDDGTLLCSSTAALGNGSFVDLTDIVYVDPVAFELEKTEEIAREIGEINKQLASVGRRYILIGFGRWGTADRWLGIPAGWEDISMAQVIVEADHEKLRADPSQGSHFHHNLVSLRLGYFHVREGRDGETIDWEWIRARPVEAQTPHVRHLRCNEPLTVKIDGRRSVGVILQPGSSRGPA